jgi:hypothetical protein
MKGKAARQGDYERTLKRLPTEVRVRCGSNRNNLDATVRQLA